MSDYRGLDAAHIVAAINRLDSEICRCGERRDTGVSAATPKLNSNNQFAGDMWDVIDDLGNLLLDKQDDYGPLNISNAPGGPLNGLRVRIYDKIARINNLIESGNDPRNESLRDSFMDLANYSIIALMVLDGTWPALPRDRKTT